MQKIKNQNKNPSRRYRTQTYYIKFTISIILVSLIPLKYILRKNPRVNVSLFIPGLLTSSLLVQLFLSPQRRQLYLSFSLFIYLFSYWRSLRFNFRLRKSIVTYTMNNKIKIIYVFWVLSTLYVNHTRGESLTLTLLPPILPNHRVSLLAETYRRGYGIL